jgi:hypothetical protein
VGLCLQGMDRSIEEKLLSLILRSWFCRRFRGDKESMIRMGFMR